MFQQEPIPELEKELKRWGLTNLEIKVWLCLLKHKDGLPARRVADVVDVHPTNIYTWIKSLEEKGIVSKTPTSSLALRKQVGSVPMVKYIANPVPEVLDGLIEAYELERKEQILDLKESAERIKELLKVVNWGFEDYKPKIFLDYLKGPFVFNRARRVAEQYAEIRVSGGDREIDTLHRNGFFGYLKGKCYLLLAYKGSTKELKTLNKEDLKVLNKVANVKITDRDVPYFIITDKEGLVFLETGLNITDHYALHTNASEIVETYNMLFEMLYSKL